MAKDRGKIIKQFATDYSVIKAFDEEVLINDSVI